ncbi:sensor histidine kinase [Hyalangium rubrum]|uniref:histidine kinase n=1 Tax=Hyalangium rubrum TaxID=3103134 RepID=A0ABU5GXJ2_9BACT|nr:two-component regulator propeller domain-containing protein [Hyalangium sp. s54d21]MDY7225267.1 two-component regulator propeller domain-containing protein [Hyalangium sp. s54d21]
MLLGALARLWPLALVALVLVGARSAWALEPGKALSQFPHHAWQTADGLPQNSILALAQTPDGYLWGGTWEGLVRFDGARFTVFEKGNTPGLPGRTVTRLATTRDGTLWIGFKEGLVRMREGTFQLIDPPEGMVLGDPTDLQAARDGSLWIATEEHGLARLSEGRFQTWRMADGLASDQLQVLTEAPDGAIWVGGAGGLQRWSGTAWSSPLPFEGKANVTVRAVVFDREGTLWAGTEEGDVYRLQNGSLRRVPEASTPGAPHSIFLVDRAGSLWVGSLGHGLLRLANGERSVLPAGHALAGSLVAELFEDAEGNLWVGTEARGLHQLQDAPFTPYGPPEGLAHEMVLSLLEARDGSLWFGTVGGGVSRWHDGKMTTWTTRDGLILDRVRSIAETPDGSMWFGTRVGLSRLRGGAFTSYGADQGLRDMRAYQLAVDAGGTLWVGTPTGLFRWSGERFEPFTPPEGLPGTEITLLSPSAVGGLWIGTGTGGLVHLLHGSAVPLAPEQGPLPHAPRALHEAEQGVLWIGTNDGLYRWKEGQLRHFSTAEGLFDDRIFAILPDGRGHLWMSCNKGVFRVALAELEAVAEGQRARVTSRAYGEGDGMRSAECNGLGSPAGMRDRNGRLWFPTIQGAVAYTPGQEEQRQAPPPVRIEGLLVDGRMVPDSQWDNLPVGEGQIEFHYTSAGLRAPQRLSFRYQLESFDKGWVRAGSRRVAYYSQLPPGRYRFRVEAAYLDGGGAAPGAEMTLELRPRLHQTLGFRVACALALALSVAGGVLLRIHRLRVRERRLQERVDQRTAELATVNADLQARLQELQTARERLAHAEKMAAMGTLAAGVGHELNNPLASVVANLHFVAAEVREVARRDGEREGWGEITEAIDEALQGTARMTHIIQELRTLSRAEPQGPQRVELHRVLDRVLSIASGELRRRARIHKDYGTPPPVLADENRLAQVFLNLLINAAQAIPEGHAQEHEIRVTTSADAQGNAVVAVSDTGQGMAPEVVSRIFEPFFTTRSVGEGTGLGLSVCHSHVQAMGGHIRVRSEPGQGSTFSVVLPPAPPAA